MQLTTLPPTHNCFLFALRRRRVATCGTDYHTSLLFQYTAVVYWQYVRQILNFIVLAVYVTSPLFSSAAISIPGLYEPTFNSVRICERILANTERSDNFLNQLGGDCRTVSVEPLDDGTWVRDTNGGVYTYACDRAGDERYNQYCDYILADIVPADFLPSAPNPLASADEKLVPCDGPECGFCDVASLTNKVALFIVGIVTLLAILLFVYAGFLLVTSVGRQEQMTKAKSIFRNVLIGFAIVFGAWLIVDAVMRGLLTDQGQFSSDGVTYPWNAIVCVDQPVLNVAELVDRSSGLGVGGGGAVGSGSCRVLNSGACATSNLSCFGSNAQAASRVCDQESVGGQSIRSGTDLCRGGDSFSGGVFQINILANNRLIDGCDSSFFTKSGPSAQGQCLTYVTNSAGTRYCQFRDCRITDRAMYERCMGATMDPQSNIQMACQLYAESGSFQPWITSAQVCGVM